MPASPRCQVSRPDANDPTGQNAHPCNANAEYCRLCEIHICAACHSEVACPAVRFPIGFQQHALVENDLLH